MARTIEEIFNEALIEKDNLASLQELQPQIDSAQTLLNDLTSTSKVAKWRLMLWVMSFMIYLHEKLWAAYSASLTKQADEIITGTARWYRAETLLYQFGDPITWNGSQYVYSPINSANQVVKRAAVIELGGQVRIKVAKLDGSGTPIPLSAQEEAGLTTYWAQKKFAGTNLAIINRNADELRFALDLYYDALVMNGDGSLIADGTFPVEDAIKGYIFNLPFNGRFSYSEFIDAIQLAKGVISPILQSIEARAFPNAYQAIDSFYTAEAGHLKIETGTPIASMINYISYV